MKVGQSNTLWKNEDYQQRRVEDISRAVNGGLEFGNPPVVPAPPGGPVPAVVAGSGNVSGAWVNTITPGANTPFTVVHNLQRIPVGMLVFAVDQPGAVIQVINKPTWTKTQAFFACNVANVNLQGFVT